jgi:hypothetical protein
MLSLRELSGTVNEDATDCDGCNKDLRKVQRWENLEKWGEWDSNPHVRRQIILSDRRLPITPSPQLADTRQCIKLTPERQANVKQKTKRVMHQHPPPAQTDSQPKHRLRGVKKNEKVENFEKVEKMNMFKTYKSMSTLWYISDSTTQLRPTVCKPFVPIPPRTELTPTPAALYNALSRARNSEAESPRPKRVVGGSIPSGRTSPLSLIRENLHR